MLELEGKTKPRRYPLGTIKQARNTLARLTRDLLSGKIDREKYRAACYGISVQCGLFKLETPEQMNLKLSAGDIRVLEEHRKMAQISHEESLELEKELTGQILRLEDTEVLVAELARRGDLKKAISNSFPAMIEAPKPVNTQKTEEPAEAVAQIEDTGAQWKATGIGVKNR